MADKAGTIPTSKVRQHRPARFLFFALLALLILGAALLIGWLPRHKRNNEVAARAKLQQTALPVVEVQTVHKASANDELTLPGTVTPLEAAHIYARASGFLQARYVDLGDTVRKGQLLAVISAPDLETAVAQQAALLAQSAGGVRSGEAALRLQQATYDRIHTLVGHGILSQQDDDAALAGVETAQSNLHAARDAVKGAQAALAHAQVMAGFAQLRSPIAGTVTSRNVEVGSLVSAVGAAQGAAPMPAAGSTGGPPTGGAQGGELFGIVNLRSLEVFVAVPEQDAPFIQKGQPVDLSFQELPGQKYTGKVVRTSDSLNQQTRVLLAEVRVDDPQHHLRPGMFASAQLHYKAPKPGILISGDSLLTMARGQFVPVVAGGVIQMRPVQVGRDLGTQVYITSGLEDGDLVVVNPNDAVQEGARVTPRPAPQGQEGAAAKPGKGGQ